MYLGKIKLNELDKKDWLKTIITLLVYVGGMFTFFYLEHHLYNLDFVIEEYHCSELIAEHGIAGVCFALVTFSMAVIFIIVNFDLLKKQFTALTHHIKPFIIYTIVGTVLVFIIQWANVNIFLGPNHAYTRLSNDLAGIYSPLLIISAVFFVAFVEEIFYKVVCYLPVESLPVLQSSIVSALIFGIFNTLIFLIAFPDLAFGAFCFYTLLGLKFAFLYSRTHTIYTSIAAGTIYSMIMTLLTFLVMTH